MNEIVIEHEFHNNDASSIIEYAIITIIYFDYKALQEQQYRDSYCYLLGTI